jgi:gluconolactonase
MPMPSSLIAASARLERVSTGSTWAEGPLWLPELQVLRWSDIPNNRILEYNPADEMTRLYRDQVEFTNGRTLDLDGHVVQCSHGRRRIERDADPEPVAVVGDWHGLRLNSPNDVVVASDRSIWFSDPPYGITEPNEGHTGVREYADHYVFRHDPADGSTTAVIVDVEEPNGLAFSPDEAILYVADSSAVRRPPGVGNHHIRAYAVVDGARCKNGRVFAVIDPGFPDGIRVDIHGNVWSSAADGVHVLAPDGQELGRIEVPELVGNLCFGGPGGTDLYIAGSTSIYRITTEVRDAAQHF